MKPKMQALYQTYLYYMPALKQWVLLPALCSSYNTPAVIKAGNCVADLAVQLRLLCSPVSLDDVIRHLLCWPAAAEFNISPRWYTMPVFLPSVAA
jgi:hypothetical protein